MFPQSPHLSLLPSHDSWASSVSFCSFSMDFTLAHCIGRLSSHSMFPYHFSFLLSPSYILPPSLFPPSLVHIFKYCWRSSVLVLIHLLHTSISNHKKQIVPHLLFPILPLPLIYSSYKHSNYASRFFLSAIFGRLVIAAQGMFTSLPTEFWGPLAPKALGPPTLNN